MDNTRQNLSENDTKEISLRDLIFKIREILNYLKTKAIIIVVFALICAALGGAYAFIKKPVYTATCSFVLEDGSKGGSLGQYAGLASLAGLDLGSSSSGIFSGDNILELYKSRTMIEKTLLHEADFSGRREKLIDRYIEFEELRKKWSEKEYLKNINFNGSPDKFNRYQDSVITEIVTLFNKKILSVSKPDKKLSIINVSASCKDELFAKAFTETLVGNVNDFYVTTKTKKSLQGVEVLERQRDSVRAVLNGAISGVASSIDATPNANPSLLSLRVPSQKKQVDVQASTAIFAEIVKNLELSKISLRQETPLIQIIDAPVLPLYKDKPSKIVLSAAGFFIGGLLAAMVLVLLQLYRKITN